VVTCLLKLEVSMLSLFLRVSVSSERSDWSLVYSLPSLDTGTRRKRDNIDTSNFNRQVTTHFSHLTEVSMLSLFLRVPVSSEGSEWSLVC
jgi:hypothetical protein